MDAQHRKSFGRCPKKNISGTSAIIGKWFAIFFNTDSVISTVTDNFNKAGEMDGKAFVAGSWYFGDVTSIKLTSGDATGYCDQVPPVDETDIES